MPSTKRPAQSNRLAKTLVLLVGSMTLGTAALNWIHDLTNTAETTPKPLILARTARAAPWNRIVIRPQSGSHVPFHHFLVGDAAGTQGDADEHLTVAWQRQEQDPRNPGAVVIVVSQRRGAGGITRGQWESLASRIRELQTRYQISTRNIGLTLDSGLDSRIRGEADQLNRMLQTAGLVG